MKNHKAKIYEIADKKVIWYWDEEETNAAHMTCDNLDILNSEGHLIWNLRDAMAYEDICVDMKVLDNNRIRFITWNGWNIVFDVRNMRVEAKRQSR